MKKILVLFFIGILIIGNENIIFASYKNQGDLNEEMQQYLQEVFEHRVNVWNDFINKELSIEEVKNQLIEYTTEPLITSDLQTFENIINNPTSYETIKEVHIQKCKTIKIQKNRGTFLVEILWLLEDDNKLIYEEIKYIVEMYKEKNKWLLSNYQLNQ